jgi:hypothetical protein
LQSTENINLSTNTVEFPITSTYTTIKSVIYTDEKVKNGTMEINDNWNSVGTPTVNARSATQVNNGTYSRQFNVDAADEGIKSDVHILTVNYVYYYRASVYPDHTGNVNVQVIDGCLEYRFGFFYVIGGRKQCVYCFQVPHGRNHRDMVC